MKKHNILRIHYYFITVLFMLLHYNSGAQQITKEDALAFINKVINEFPRNIVKSPTDRLWGFEEKAVLDGSVLKIITVYYSQDEEYKKFGYYYTTDTTTLNLSSVYFGKDSSIMSQTRGDIRIHNVSTRYKNNNNIDKKADPIIIADDLLGFNEFSAVNVLQQQFLDKGYDVRYPRALRFLIMACGGGKPIKTGNDKF